MTTATRHGAIELHCHIDGCVRPATIEALAEPSAAGARR